MMRAVDFVRVRPRVVKVAFGLACAAIAATTILAIQTGAAARPAAAQTAPVPAASSGGLADTSPMALSEVGVVQQSNPAPAFIPLAVKELLKGTYLAWGYNKALSGGTNAMDSAVVIKCPLTVTHCTYAAEQHAQVYTSNTGIAWGICTQVDGVWMDAPPCPNLGAMTVNDYTARAFTQTKVGLTPGNHTVQTFLSSGGSATLYYWQVTYRVYAP